MPTRNGSGSNLLRSEASSPDYKAEIKDAMKGSKFDLDAVTKRSRLIPKLESYLRTLQREKRYEEAGVISDSLSRLRSKQGNKS
jgi:protein-arginine kinase activator protein McsA